MPYLNCPSQTNFPSPSSICVFLPTAQSLILFVRYSRSNFAVSYSIDDWGFDFWKMTYNMLRRTKSSSLLPLVRYFYGDSPEDSSKDMFPNDTTSQQSTCTTRSISISSAVDVWNSRITASGNAPSGSLTPPPDYEQLYQAMQLENHDDRVRKKYACQGLKLVASSLAEDSDALSGREVGFSRD